MTERSAYLSVIIPMYNEEANVSRLYKQLRRVLIQQKISYEIICVDDGSSDGTFRELCNLALCDPCLRVIQLRGAILVRQQQWPPARIRVPAR